MLTDNEKNDEDIGVLRAIKALFKWLLADKSEYCDQPGEHCSKADTTETDRQRKDPVSGWRQI